MRLKDTGLTAQELKDMVNKYMVETYERYDFIAERAEGMYLYDEEGNAYLDFYGGVAVNSCGNRNPKVIAAIKDQLDDIMHTFNYPYTIPQALLAKKICDTIGMDKIFYQNSGTEANECMIKMARKYGVDNFGPERYHIITAKHGFHGRTYGAMSATGQPDNAIQMGFKPMLPGFDYAEYNNLEDFKSKVTENTIAIMIEPVQGEGGVHPATQEFIEGLRKLCDKLPEALEKIAPVLIYPVFGILGIGLLMNFAVEPIMGAINTALNNGLTGMGGSSKIVLGLILGGMMAIDMGGPFNKAAYVFGTASIAAGNFDIMEAVMIGGMTPPCAIALATLLFKNKFTKSEREAGPTNFVMGLAFITEGAIPYAAADPLHVLPSCIVGSAAAGALSMAFGCTLMAPHGGIFVFPVVGNALMYLVALVVGTVISAVLLGVLKKKVA